MLKDESIGREFQERISLCIKVSRERDIERMWVSFESMMMEGA